LTIIIDKDMAGWRWDHGTVTERRIVKKTDQNLSNFPATPAASVLAWLSEGSMLELGLRRSPGADTKVRLGSIGSPGDPDPEAAAVESGTR